MEMLELLNPEDFTHFYLRADLVEKIIPARGGCCEILTTTGRWVHCGDSPDYVAKMVRASTESSAKPGSNASNSDTEGE